MTRSLSASLFLALRSLLRLRRAKRASPLRTELANLERLVAKNDQRLQEVSDDFWRNGGVCCPNCGVRGYSKLEDKQQRRMARIAGIKRKLECS